MIASLMSVFVLGIRHGADPDHLAIIDNMTRNSYAGSPKSSRFVGTLFALGHSVMVLCIAAIVGTLGGHFRAQGAALERAGTLVSLGILLLVAGINVAQLLHDGEPSAGYRSRLFAPTLRLSNHVLVALPVGLLFGLGFETSSQLATYTLAFTVGAGAVGALAIGLAFCAGIVCTDTLDSVLVHRFMSASDAVRLRAKRTWLWAVTCLAVVVALYEGAQFAGWRPPFPELGFSAGLVAVLGAVYIFIITQARLPRRAS
ncbi:MAG TPA: hypothetical protein VME66_02920 [Candidatus Acidoferrales bacterium]|nr:hypothetical protein [Candidatus Acidoferrales bacterium]